MTASHQLFGGVLLVAVTMGFTQAREPQQDSRSETDRNSVVLEGCLRTADQSVASAESKAMPEFILTGARTPERTSRSPTVGTTGRSGSTRTADGTVTVPNDRDTPKTYLLVGYDHALSAYEGRRVEITGTIEPPAPSDADKPAPSASDAVRSATERLRIVLIRPVADTCSKR
jgi:hypothetical protein